MTVALDASITDAENRGSGQIDENFTTQKIIPQIAYTLNPNVTAGLGLETSFIDVEEEVSGNATRFDYRMTRPFAGVSYHDESKEFGIMYASELITSNTGSDRNPAETLSLVIAPSVNERAIYLPSVVTAYARGNMSDSFSMMSTVSFARYDGNVEGAIDYFDRYESTDRLAANVSGTYWTGNRSHLTLAVEYQGAANSPIGTEEQALGYRLANLYGGTLEGVLSINRRAYIGALVSFHRGERNDEGNDGLRYNASEENSRIADS